MPEIEKSAAASYVAPYLNFFGSSALLNKRIALDEHSSVGRNLSSEIFSVLGAEEISLWRVDTFVPIDTQAVRREDVGQATVRATQYKFGAIISTAGDADRPLVGGKNRKWLSGDTKELGADIVVTPVSTNTEVKKYNAFSKVVRTRIGSP